MPPAICPLSRLSLTLGLSVLRRPGGGGGGSQAGERPDDVCICGGLVPLPLPVRPGPEPRRAMHLGGVSRQASRDEVIGR